MKTGIPKKEIPVILRKSKSEAQKKDCEIVVEKCSPYKVRN